MMKTASEKLDWIEGNVKGFAGKDLLSMNQNSVKLIKAAPGSAYPEHVHPEKTEYAFVLEGEVEIAINGSTFSGKAGDFFVFPKQQRHAIRNPSKHDCLLLIGALADKM